MTVYGQIEDRLKRLRRGRAVDAGRGSKTVSVNDGWCMYVCTYLCQCLESVDAVIKSTLHIIHQVFRGTTNDDGRNGTLFRLCNQQNSLNPRKVTTVMLKFFKRSNSSHS